MTQTSTSRRVFGIVRLAAATALIMALGYQIGEKVANDDLIADQYFVYFTVESSMIAAVTMIVGGILAFRRHSDTVLYTMVRMSVVTYSVVTAVVYNALLRGIPDPGFVSTLWPGELMHVWVPLVILLDWLFAPGRPALRWTGLRYVVIFPLAWVGLTMLRGALTDFYPYPFLLPSTGWPSVAIYIVGIAAFIVGIAALAIAWSRRGAVVEVREGHTG